MTLYSSGGSTSIKEHLENLGLGTKASKRDIRVAYHKQALKYHPDKNVGNEECEAKFKDISESYDILMQLLEGSADDAVIDLENTEDAGYWNDMLNRMLHELLSYIARKVNEKKKTVAPSDASTAPRSDVPLLDIDLQVPLEDVYNGRIKRLRVSVLKWPHRVPETGKLNYGSEELYISLLNYKSEYLFSKKGDYLTETERGDIKVNLKVQDHPLVKIDQIVSPYDLHAEFDISLYGYYTREFLAFEYFGEVIDVPYEPAQTVCVVKGKGLPYYDSEDDEEHRGDLYVFFKLVLPQISRPLSQDLLDVLSKYFVHNICSNAESL